MFDEEDFNSVNDEQSDFVDTQNDSDNDVSTDVDSVDESDNAHVEGEKESGTADQKHVQSKDENAIYAQMRRKAEAEAKAKLAEYERHIKEIEQYTGMKIDQVTEHVKNNYTQQQVEQAAERYGVTEEIARVILEQSNKISSIEQKEQERERQHLNNQQKVEFKDKKFFRELEPEIDQLVATNPGVDVRTAYFYLRGQRMDELIEKENKNTEKRTIANIHDRAKRGIETSSDGDIDPQSVLSNEGLIMAREMGVSPKSVAKRLAQKFKK